LSGVPRRRLLFLADVLRCDGVCFKRESAEACKQLRKTIFEAFEVELPPKGVAFYLLASRK
jgi:hypothetical protein